MFDPKGRVLVQASNANGVIKWKMDSKQVNIIFEDHVDVLYLPIDPNGTKGMDQHGNDVIATQVPGSAKSSAQAAGTPSALDALETRWCRRRSSAHDHRIADYQKNGISCRGRLVGKTGCFAPNGTMTIENNARTAHWQLTDKQIVMTFKDHKDILFLPLDPNGTKGEDEYGRLIIATQVDETASVTVSAPANGATSRPPSGAGSSYFGSASNNGPAATATPVPQSPP